MDPNETLRALRNLTVRHAAGGAEMTALELEDWAVEMRETFEALDGWLSAGGFPPEAWREGPDAVGEAPPELADVVNPHTGQPWTAEPLGGPHPGVDGHLPDED